jgi:ABC-type transport system involved in cytochrome bd biosynthesis fused ATPase/permease subunit
MESTVLAVHACRGDDLALRCAGHVLIATAIAAAVWLRAWQPLLLCAAVLVLPLLRIAMIQRRVRALSRTLDSIRQQLGFQLASYLQFASDLDWSPIRMRDKDRLLVPCQGPASPR